MRVCVCICVQTCSHERVLLNRWNRNIAIQDAEESATSENENVFKRPAPPTSRSWSINWPWLYKNSPTYKIVIFKVLSPMHLVRMPLCTNQKRPKPYIKRPFIVNQKPFFSVSCAPVTSFTLILKDQTCHNGYPPREEISFPSVQITCKMFIGIFLRIYVSVRISLAQLKSELEA